MKGHGRLRAVSGIAAFTGNRASTGQSENGPIADRLKCALIDVIPKIDARSWKLPLPELEAVAQSWQHLRGLC